MKKMKKIFAVILSLAMVLGMSMTAFAAKVTDQYTDKITVSNLAADVETTLKVYNIIYLDQDAAGNQHWEVVDWAKDYVSENNKTGEFKITNASKLKEAADKQSKADVEVKEKGTFHEFTNLPIGAYVIRAFDAKGTYGLMVANTYNNDGQTYMASKAASVTAKMENYNVKKEANDKFVSRGQRVNFTVTTQMASKKDADNKDLTTFKVIDTSTGLKADSFKLESVKIAGDTKTVDESKVTAVPDNGKVTYTVDLSEFIANTDAGATVEVKYSAVVENDHTYNNSATVDSNTVNYTPGIVNGFEGTVTLKKVDTKGTTLNGAEFQLLKVTPATEEGAEATKTAISVVKVKDGEYKVALDGEEGATTTLVATNGTLKITGLGDGDYEFKETKAPTGYKVNPDNKAFTITADEEKEVTVDAGEFVNTKLSALPSTGGIGTTIFTIAGCVIMIAAAGFFFASRKKANR